ncbi:PPC domain-containing protein [Adhaeretor mobilis]|uniref:Putative subtilase-type serine protease n=1 Tax=Adhaeretor mobilis TaxID=1930276 RepID=A0A517MZI4_9BACT|nr:PPC domain-containing protein [Adhaeretor mobilis]QDT00299.1 putative subtilase-type serine protease precursor [Adhaeretor mobilis]
MKNTSHATISRNRNCCRNIRLTILRLAANCVVLTTLATNVVAGDPRLQQLKPQGATRGQEVEVQVVAVRAGKDSLELMFSRPGIEVTELKHQEKNRYLAKLNIAEDCPLGRHPVRLRTASGLTNLLTFHVGMLPTISEVEPNNSVETAQPIEGEVTVQGTILPEDLDYFRLNLEAGDRISIEVEGLRLGRTFFDPCLLVTNASGEQVAHCDDAPLTWQDPFVTFTAAEAGEYTVQLREAAYRGNNLSTYRMHVGQFPRPSGAFPPGGKPGEKLEVTWLGTNSGMEKETIELPPAGTSGRGQATAWVFPKNEQGIAPSGVPVRIIDLPRTLEVEPNNGRKSASECEVPGVVTGIIREENDRDLFRFTAKKSAVLDIYALARSLRSPLDPVIRILAADGKRLGGNDDSEGRPDSFVRFKAPADGEYLLEVRDHLNRGGPGFVYWVEMTPPKPAVEVKVEELRRYFATTLDVPQGGLTAAMLSVSEKNRNASVDLVLKDLPPGVEAQMPALPKNLRRLPILLRAKPDAPLSGSLATFKFPEGDLQPSFNQQTWLIRGLNNRPVWSHYEDRVPVSVTKKIPFKVEIVAPQAPLVRNGSKNLKVVAVRDEGFDDSIKVHLLYNPTGVSSNRSRSILKGKTEAIIPITANNNIAVEEWPIAVLAEASIGGRIVSASEFVTLKVAEAYLNLAFPTVAVQQGEPVEYVVGVAVNTPFSNEAEATLLGLPPGVTAQPVRFSADAKELKFTVQTTPQSRVGRHRQVSCRVVITENGEPVTHNLGRGELRIDPLPKAEEKEKASQAASTPSPEKRSSS